MDTLKLYGVPGSGKTTRGLDWLEERLQEGADPWRTAFVSFTNAAVDEATARIQQRFGLEKSDLPYCRTIHSLCKRQLEDLPDDWIAEKHVHEFGQQYGYDMGKSKGKAAEDGDDFEAMVSKSGKDAPYMQIWDFARHRLIDHPQSAWDTFYDYAPDSTRGLEPGRFLGWLEDYEAWKAASGLLDFTDLLLRYIESGKPTPVELAVIDEAQDLSPLMWKARDVLFANADYSAVLGDDDQAIACFMGAAPELMNSCQAHEIIKLEHSWRCPAAVSRLAQSIIRLNRNREVKTISPREGEEGVTQTIFDLAEMPLLNGESWGVMARNWNLLDHAAKQLEEKGVPYLYSDWRYSPWCDRGPLRAFRAICRLRATGACTHEELQAIASKTRMDTEKKAGAWMKGAKKRIKELADEDPHGKIRLMELPDIGLTEWGARTLLTDSLGLLAGSVSERDLGAYDQATKNGSMDGRPVVLSSIHGWKGREFDNAVGLLSCGFNTAKAMSRPEGQEEERRVAYVAVTRARKRFYALEMPPMPSTFEWDVFRC